MTTISDGAAVLPHHEQQALCTSRLPYRQGRKLTAVKVYTVNDESKHLLVFGVPALNIRQETKAMFARFGKLLQFNQTKYPGEQFTETYHALFESIHSARIAKKMLDTKNYYGGNLHVCYAPELETVSETKEKIMLRQKDVVYRLHNLKKENKNIKFNVEQNLNVKILQNENQDVGAEIINECQDDLESESDSRVKLNMGEDNLIYTGKKSKRKKHGIIIEKIFKPTFSNEKPIDIIDCTSTEECTVTNIDASLNYNNFGNEVIRQVPQKTVNRIKFNIDSKNSLF